MKLRAHAVAVAQLAAVVVVVVVLLVPVFALCITMKDVAVGLRL